MVTGGSIAVKQRDTFLKWLEKYGAEKIILGADAKNGNIAVSGWLETTELPVIEFISEYYKNGILKVISTDISRDGMLSGPAFDLYSEIMKSHQKLKLLPAVVLQSLTTY
jgi:phosphoribosylformimino-5-aminoimidazole carboxamide ribotide isomerase